MERQEWLSLMAKADASELMGCWAAANLTPDYTELRPPEIGSVMVRGRMGGKGDAFNLGEMTVSRCSVQLLRHGGSWLYQGPVKTGGPACCAVRCVAANR